MSAPHWDDALGDRLSRLILTLAQNRTIIVQKAYDLSKINNRSLPNESRAGHVNGQPGRRVGSRNLRKLRRVWKTTMTEVNCAVYNDMKVVFRDTVCTVRKDARSVDHGSRVLDVDHQFFICLRLILLIRISVLFLFSIGLQ